MIQTKDLIVILYDVTIDDPNVSTKPWTVRVSQRLLVDTDLIEFVCSENEKFSSRFRN